jgi:hypothetical protein
MFEKTIIPCVNNDVIRWHLVHGWVWDVVADGRRIGVLYATIMCGDGVVLHFFTVPGIRIPAAVIREAFRKALRITAPLGVVFATIPKRRRSLIKLCIRLGFVETSACFHSDVNGEIAFLKYLNPQNAIFK